MKITLNGKNGIYLFETEGTNVLRPNGRFSLVFKGIEINSGRPVIIKQLHPRLQHSERELKRFSDEFNMNPGLNFMPATLDYVNEEGRNYIIREYIPGTDFKSFLLKGTGGRKLNTRKQLEILISLFEKVKLLHGSGYIHGDIKPSNFIIEKDENEDYRIKLIDLGLAFAKDEIKSVKRNEKDPLPFSFHYSAPELMLNFPELAGVHSDIFSLGVIMFEWLNGESAWADQHPAALTNLQLSQPLPPTGRVKGDLYSIIEKATFRYNFQQPPNRYETTVQKLFLQEAIEKRYTSVDEFIKVIEIYKNNLQEQKGNLHFWNLNRWFHR